MASNESGLVIPKYGPGFALLLTPFELFGVPWALNPILFGGSLLVLHRVARDIFPDEPTAPGWAILFALASPQLIVTSFSYYTMPGHLFFNLAFSALLLRPSPRRSLLAGVCGAFALLQHEPHPHIIYALPWLVWLFFQRNRFRNLAALVAGYLPVLLLIGGAYAKARVDALGTFSGLSMGTSTPVLLEYFAIPSIGLVWVRVLAILKLWLWAMPGLLVLAAFGLREVRRRTGLEPFVGAFFLMFLAPFFFTGSQGHGWGYRHLHYGYAVLALLATAAVLRTQRQANARSSVKANLAPVAASVAAMSLVLCNFQRGAQVEHHLKAHLAQLPPHDPEMPGVVFVSLKGFYAVDLVQNDPFLRNPTWYLASTGADNDRRLMANLFPGAELYSRQNESTAWVLPAPPTRMLLR
jgi:hypothetical protein